MHAMNSDSQPSLRVLWRSGLGASLIEHETPPAGVDMVVDTDAGASDLAGVQVLVDGGPPGELLDVPSLQRVIVPFAGIRTTLREAVQARPGLTLHNSHFNAPFVAQHALALLLACSDRLTRYDQALRRGDWRQGSGPKSVHLAGRTAVLLGYGAIGRALVPMLRGLGMAVEAVRRRPDRSAHEVREHATEDLANVLPRADVLIVSLPDTPATTGLLDADALAAMPQGALVVNVGRGNVLDEDAAWSALERGHLGSLGLDVWWRYPDDREARAATLPSRRPFHLHPDVVLSPHRANAVVDWERASVHDVFATLSGIVTGDDPNRNRVNVETGY